MLQVPRGDGVVQMYLCVPVSEVDAQVTTGPVSIALYTGFLNLF